MADKLDLSLDDIIKINKKTKTGGAGRGRGGRRGGRGGASRGGVSQARNKRGGGGGTRGRGRGSARQPYTRGKIPDRWEHDMYKGKSAGAVRSGVDTSRGGGVGKLLVSNLDYAVSDSDITELFSEFGALRKSAVHYDRTGRSLGSADVHFERKSDALRALKQYNEVPLDGRVMQIRFVDGATPTKSNDMNGRIGQRKPTGAAGTGRGGQRRGGFRGRGRGRGAGRTPKKEVSAEELDKQLDDYISKMEE